ncbi:MAG: DUF362 domain-containing protein, partial [Gemmataceae bacterium]
NDPEFADTTDINVSLMGWPWAEGTFSWVEPTSWACLSLRLAGRGETPRVQEGLRLLLDRAFTSGGANYGNRMILGKSTEPIPGPSAMMLLALQGVDDPRVDAALGYLRTHTRQTTDLEHLAQIKLALACHPTEAANAAMFEELDTKIRGALVRETLAGPGRLALAALALEAPGRNPLRVTEPGRVAQSETSRGPSPFAAPKRSLGERISATARGILVNGMNRLRPLPATSAVHIARCPDYATPILPLLKQQFEHFRPHLPNFVGKRVVLKPNLVEYRQAKVINTDPRLIDAVIQLFQEAGAGEVVVAEGPGHWRNVQFLVEESGLGAVLRARGVSFVDINHDEPLKELNLGRTTG